MNRRSLLQKKISQTVTETVVSHGSGKDKWLSVSSTLLSCLWKQGDVVQVKVTFLRRPRNKRLKNESRKASKYLNSLTRIDVDKQIRMAR